MVLLHVIRGWLAGSPEKPAAVRESKGKQRVYFIIYSNKHLKTQERKTGNK